MADAAMSYRPASKSRDSLTSRLDRSRCMEKRIKTRLDRETPPGTEAAAIGGMKQVWSCQKLSHIACGSQCRMRRKHWSNIGRRRLTLFYDWCCGCCCNLQDRQQKVQDLAYRAFQWTDGITCTLYYSQDSPESTTLGLCTPQFSVISMPIGPFPSTDSWSSPRICATPRTFNTFLRRFRPRMQGYRPRLGVGKALLSQPYEPYAGWPVAG